MTSRKEEPNGTKGCPTKLGQHLLWHMLEKKIKRIKHPIRMKKKEEEEYKKEENTNERGGNTQSVNCNSENHMNKSLFTYFYKSVTVFGFLFKFPIAD